MRNALRGVPPVIWNGTESVPYSLTTLQFCRRIPNRMAQFECQPLCAEGMSISRTAAMVALGRGWATISIPWIVTPPDALITQLRPLRNVLTRLST